MTVADDYLSVFATKRISYSIDTSSKTKIVEGLLDLALDGLDVDEAGRRSLLRAVQKREQSGSTAVGRVAIPHVKSDKVPQTVGALGVFPRGIDFQAVDGETVFSVFLLISPTGQAEEHVNALRWVAGLVRRTDYNRFIRQTSTAEEAHSLLEELGG